ncbi:MAG TPA: M48 family metalloprotease [Terriglobia bacterium]|jgi:predicted Zn-dependent protease
MKSIRIKILVLAASLMGFAPVAHAQLKGVLGGLKKVEDVKDKTEKNFDVTPEEEAQIGAQVSANVRQKYGVVQDPEIHKYVALVGTTLAHRTESTVTWHFIVLDTDGVNAFAAPGGYIHITRGALSLLKNESELAGVLGHELIHVTKRHAINSLRATKGSQFAQQKTGVKDDPALIQRMADELTKIVLAGYGRDQELESDSQGFALAAKAGYDPAGLRKFLGALNDRNKDSQAKQGLFASHPEMQERLDKLDAAITKDKSGSTAVLAERFGMRVKYAAVDLGKIAVVADGTKGLTDDSSSDNSKKDDADKKDDKKSDDKKPSRFSLGGLKNATSGGNDSKQSASVSGSGGSRGVDRELNAKGGSNPAAVAVMITDAELAAFIREGNLHG